MLCSSYHLSLSSPLPPPPPPTHTQSSSLCHITTYSCLSLFSPPLTLYSFTINITVINDPSIRNIYCITIITSLSLFFFSFYILPPFPSSYIYLFSSLIHFLFRLSIFFFFFFQIQLCFIDSFLCFSILSIFVLLLFYYQFLPGFSSCLYVTSTEDALYTISELGQIYFFFSWRVPERKNKKVYVCVGGAGGGGRNIFQ